MTASYIRHIIDRVNEVTARCGPVLLYGENIDTGSRISGLARGLTVNPAGRILNVGNCELAHCGIGFGVMIDRGNAALFMKQLDFLLLGLDQLVNTFNFIRAYRPKDQVGSFTIFLIICDQGHQGPQSSMNSASDFASMANVDVYCLNAASDAAAVVGDRFVAGGFRVMCLSQRLFGAPALDLPAQWHSADRAIFRYRSGDDATLLCYNFALRQGVELADRAAAAGLATDLFHANFVPGADLSPLVESCKRTGKLAILDDSKSVTKFGDMLLARLLTARVDVEVLNLTRRGCPDRDYGVCGDQFVVDRDAVAAFMRA